MKICWDNLEKLQYNSKTGNFRIGKHILEYRESCDNCKAPYLGRKDSISSYCTIDCSLKSEDHLQKVKTANKIRTITRKTRDKISKIHKGKYVSYITRKRISDNHAKPMLNKHHSDATKKILSECKLKEKNPNWKGGISCEPYCTQWTDKEYKDWLKYERDGGKCQNPQCNHITTKLCLHHINYDKKDCRPNNLITICVSCNGKANKDREWHQSWYTEMVKIITIRSCSDAAA